MDKNNNTKDYDNSEHYNSDRVITLISSHPTFKVQQSHFAAPFPPINYQQRL